MATKNETRKCPSSSAYGAGLTDAAYYAPVLQVSPEATLSHEPREAKAAKKTVLPRGLELARRTFPATQKRELRSINLSNQVPFGRPQLCCTNDALQTTAVPDRRRRHVSALGINRPIRTNIPVTAQLGTPAFPHSRQGL